MNRSILTAAACGLVVALGGCAGTVEPMSEPMTIAPRGDNPNLPNPVTPSAANEGAPQPQGTLRDPTNQSGMQRGGSTGATY